MSNEREFWCVLSGEVAIDAPLPMCSREHTLSLSKGTARMTKPSPTPDLEITDSEAICSTTTIAALLLLGAQFPHRQFNSAELSVLSGIGRTAMLATTAGQRCAEFGDGGSLRMRPNSCVN
jgi:hypothetical protein